MIKKLFFAALAITALASCSSNDFVGDESPQGSIGTNGAITFQYNVQNATRGTSDDATKLNNQFIVWGEKNESSGSEVTDGNLVFPNYIVNYGASTAYTTTSNTNNWEYVGFKFDDTNTSYYSTNITPNTKPQQGDIPAQTIKYWDDNATSYTFTAISAKPADISNGLVKIQKNKTGTDVYAKGYTVTLAKSTGETPTYPSLSDLYVSDRINIARGEGYTHNAVSFTFRNSLSQIRAGIYETIPGYNISSIKFYVNTSGDTPTQTEEAKVGETAAFGAVCDNSKTDNFEGTITVTYYNTGTDVNKPILTVTPNDGVKKSNLILGTNLNSISTTSLLGETASSPSWDRDAGAYTAVLPQTANNPLKLKCDYTLYNPVTKETIEIKGKTAEIPAQYLQWKANYKYSYIFKITDDDLNPITFDAVVVTDAMGNAEYITTVTQPSITTFGVILDSDNKFKNYVTGNNEYQIPSGGDKLDIYATFMQGANVLTPQLTSSDKTNYVTVYFVDYKNGATDVEKAEKPITEGSVAESIASTANDKLIVATAIQTTTNENTYFYDHGVPAPVTSVPAEDGTTKTINAVKLPGVITAGKYAVEIVTYTGSVPANGTSLDGYYSVSGDTYSAASGTADGTSTYYKQVKTYKVITVVAAP